jgi:hypothetical protein
VLFDIDRLNSATKYPSIDTHHILSERGRLTEAVGPFDGIDPDEEVYATEKVDGTNIRVVRLPNGDYFIGLREELVYAKGDRIITSAQDGAIHPVLPVAERISSDVPEMDAIQVFFMEVYGGKVGGAAKNYTSKREKSFRLFDIAFVSPEVLRWERADIASWREHGGQLWAREAVLQRGAAAAGIQLTPRLGVVPGGSLPTDLEGTYKWLQAALPESLVTLDAEAGKKAEGVVFRTNGRTRISKARFQDYAKVLEPQTGRKKG